jgi:beta-glucosidase
VLADSHAREADTRVFFAAGRAGEGWHWAVREGVDELDLPQASGASPHGGLTLSAADRTAQEDARLLRFTGTGPKRAALTGARIDLTREANGQLSLAMDYRVDEPPAAAVELRLECGPDCHGAVPVQAPLRAAPAGEWRHLKVPLSCFAQTGADLGHVTAPFALATAGPLTVRLANIRLETGTDGLMPCGG